MDIKVLDGLGNEVPADAEGMPGMIAAAIAQLRGEQLEGEPIVPFPTPASYADVLNVQDQRWFPCVGDIVEALPILEEFTRFPRAGARLVVTRAPGQFVSEGEGRFVDMYLGFTAHMRGDLDRPRVFAEFGYDSRHFVKIGELHDEMLPSQFKDAA